MNIRQEQPDEFGKIYELVQSAFQTAKVSDGTEQDFVNKLREGNGYLSQLALVAEENGELIGHIMLTKCPVVNGQETHEILLLAPLSVRLEYRNRGVGSALIAESARLAREMGYGAIILVGDPGYYSRSGFVPAADFGIHYANVPDQFVQVLVLKPDGLKGVAGIVDVH